jgi:hypothetical protein
MMRLFQDTLKSGHKRGRRNPLVIYQSHHERKATIPTASAALGASKPGESHTALVLSTALQLFVFSSCPSNQNKVATVRRFSQVREAFLGCRKWSAGTRIEASPPEASSQDTTATVL